MEFRRFLARGNARSSAIAVRDIAGTVAKRLPDGSRSPPRRSRTHTCTRRARARARRTRVSACLSLSLSHSLGSLPRSLARHKWISRVHAHVITRTLISATRCDTFTASRARSSSSMSDDRRRSSYIDRARRFHGTLVRRTRGNGGRAHTHGRDRHLHSLLSPRDGFLRALRQHAGKSDVAQDGSGRLTVTRGGGQGTSNQPRECRRYRCSTSSRPTDGRSARPAINLFYIARRSTDVRFRPRGFKRVLSNRSTVT